MSEEINLTDTMTALIPVLKLRGFGGVRFRRLKLWEQSLEDFQEDGKTREEWERWRRDYICLEVDPDFPFFDDDDDSPYVEPRRFDTDSWFDDFRKMLHEQLGSGLNIGRLPQCGEMEIQRIKTSVESSR